MIPLRFSGAVAFAAAPFFDIPAMKNSVHKYSL